MSARMNFLAWRVSFQSDEQAAIAAYLLANTLAAQLEAAKAELRALAGVTDVDGSTTDAQDCLASHDEAEKPAGITRSPGRCSSCAAPLGAVHAANCLFANLLVRRSA